MSKCVWFQIHAFCQIYQCASDLDAYWLVMTSMTSMMHESYSNETVLSIFLNRFQFQNLCTVSSIKCSACICNKIAFAYYNVSLSLYSIYLNSAYFVSSEMCILLTCVIFVRILRLSCVFLSVWVMQIVYSEHVWGISSAYMYIICVCTNMRIWLLFTCYLCAHLIVHAYFNQYKTVSHSDCKC